MLYGVCLQVCSLGTKNASCLQVCRDSLSFSTVSFAVFVIIFFFLFTSFSLNRADDSADLKRYTTTTHRKKKDENEGGNRRQLVFLGWRAQSCQDLGSLLPSSSLFFLQSRPSLLLYLFILYIIACFFFFLSWTTLSSRSLVYFLFPLTAPFFFFWLARLLLGATYIQQKDG